jgi:hypothetical protein
MKFPKLVVLSLALDPSTAFVAPFRRPPIFAGRLRQSLLKEGGSDGQEESSFFAEEPADKMAKIFAGIDSGLLPGFLAPLAAAAAGRQLLMNRDKVIMQVASTEAQLRGLQEDVQNTSNLITVRFVFVFLFYMELS